MVKYLNTDPSVNVDALKIVDKEFCTLQNILLLNRNYFYKLLKINVNTLP